MKLKKLPIGKSTLRNMLEENYLYVDKTKIALDLINGDGDYYFLSRPRRFGKSLFLDTLKTIFSGNKEVFKDLYIYDKYEFIKYPIIHISFGSGAGKTKADFEQKIYEILDKNQKDLKISCPEKFSSAGCFKRLTQPNG